MSDLNRVVLIGRLTADPMLKYTQSGTAVASFSIAVGKTYSQNGECKEQTSFFNCIAWSKLGETISQYCKKGHRIGIEGQLQQRRWEDQEGSKKSIVEVVVSGLQFLQAKQTDDSQPAQEPPMSNDWGDSPFNDDNIPF